MLAPFKVGSTQDAGSILLEDMPMWGWPGHSMAFKGSPAACPYQGEEMPVLVGRERVWRVRFREDKRSPTARKDPQTGQGRGRDKEDIVFLGFGEARGHSVDRMLREKVDTWSLPHWVQCSIVMVEGEGEGLALVPLPVPTSYPC